MRRRHQPLSRFDPLCTWRVSLCCGDCGALLKSVQEHEELTKHSNFSESIKAILNLVCTTCGKPYHSRTESDLHIKRTGHADFDDRTLEAAKQIELEASHKAAAELVESVGEESVQTEDMIVLEVDKNLLEKFESMEFPTACATRALYFYGNSSIEAAINWAVEHEDDSDIDQMPLVFHSGRFFLL